MANVPISAFTVPANTVGIGATGYSLTGSASASFMDLAGTWNTSGTPTAIKLNITDTASNAASLLMDLGTGGGSFVSRFSVSKAGGVTGSSFRQTSSGAGIQVNANSSRLLLYSNNTELAYGDGSNFTLSSTVQLSWSPSTASSGSVDLFLTRRGAANLRLGAADAAAPVAQTLSVQSVVATGANQAGADFTITGSQGRGSGAGGSIIFQVAPAGTSGSGLQNALATALTLDSTSTLTLTGPSVATFDVMYLGAGASKIRIGVGDVQMFNAAGNRTARFSTDGAYFASDGTVGFTNSATNSYATVDVALRRDAANTLALRNGTAAQTFRVYNTTDGTNSEFLSVNWATTNIASIGVGTAGTGAPQILRFTSARSGADTAWEFRSTASTSPRIVFAGTDRSVTLSAESNMLNVVSGGYRSSIDYAAGASTVFALQSINSNATVTHFGIVGSAANVMQINNGSGRGSGYGAATEMWEMTAPAAPAANGVRIYAVDNGSGKTQLMAIFATGAAQQIAIEP
jgi:hypothetical protein